MAGVNFGELVQGANFNTGPRELPEGRYTAEIREVEVNQTQAGNDRVQVVWVIVEGEEAGVKVRDNRSFVVPAAGTDEKARKKIDRFFSAMGTIGLSREFFQTGPSLEQVATAMKGKRADIVTENEEYKGRMYPRVRWVNRASVQAAPAGPVPMAAPGGFTPPQAATRPSFSPPPISQMMSRPPTPPAAASAAPPAAPAAPVEQESVSVGADGPVEF